MGVPLHRKIQPSPLRWTWKWVSSTTSFSFHSSLSLSKLSRSSLRRLSPAKWIVMGGGGPRLVGGGLQRSTSSDLLCQLKWSLSGRKIVNYTHYTKDTQWKEREQEGRGEEGRRGGGKEGRTVGREREGKTQWCGGAINLPCEPSDESWSDKHQGIWVACMSTLARQVEIERENFPDVDKLCLPILSSDLTFCFDVLLSQEGNSIKW